MSIIDWKNIPRKCWCGKIFIPSAYNQVHCCKAHARIFTAANGTIFGRQLLKGGDGAVDLLTSWYSSENLVNSHSLEQSDDANL